MKSYTEQNRKMEDDEDVEIRLYFIVVNEKHNVKIVLFFRVDPVCIYQFLN